MWIGFSVVVTVWAKGWKVPNDTEVVAEMMVNTNRISMIIY